MTSRRTIFIFILGTSAGLIPFLLSRSNNSKAVLQKQSSSDLHKSDFWIAERNVQRTEQPKESSEAVVQSGIHNEANIPKEKSETQKRGQSNINNDKPRYTKTHRQVNERTFKTGSRMPLEHVDNTVSKPTSVPQVKARLVTRTNLRNRWEELHRNEQHRKQSHVSHPTQFKQNSKDGETRSKTPKIVKHDQKRINVVENNHQFQQLNHNFKNVETQSQVTNRRHESNDEQLDGVSRASIIEENQDFQQLRHNLKDVESQSVHTNRRQESYHEQQNVFNTQASLDEGDDEWEIEEFFSKIQDGRQRKILLDCGANMASTVDLFRETYPEGREYIIHSFEIDDRLAPYFRPYQNHELHCPVGVSNKNGNMTAYMETAWSPTRGKDNGRDMQWGGGSLFVSKAEAEDTETGGRRQLGVRPTIPIIDLSSWIQSHTSKDDYVIFKLDVEGAEYDILNKMLGDGTFDWVDKYYGEFHSSQDVKGWSKTEKANLQNVEMRAHKILDWQGETRTYQDFDKMHPVKVPLRAPGIPGGIYSNCGDATKSVALALAVGMNAKRARKVIETIAAYRLRVPVTLFLYGDFAELFPDDVKHWASRFDIGVREDGDYPTGHFVKLHGNWVRESLVSAELRLQELGIQPVYYLPVNFTHTIVHEAQQRGFRLINPTYEFPPKHGITLESGNYYKYRDVERIPKALRNIHDALFVRSRGGFLVLDTDLPDTRMNIVFLLDYLIEKSGYDLISVTDCVALCLQSGTSTTLMEN